jgi:hypothetical protein
MRFPNLLITILLFSITGCASPKSHETLYKIYFPDVKLKPDESIQSVQLNITNGHVVTVNHLLIDWDTDVLWDNPSLQFVKLEARHFVDGLTNLQELDGFVTMTHEKDEPFFDIEAVVGIEATNEDFDFTIHHSDLILKKR